jgi:hypothetical protein
MSDNKIIFPLDIDFNEGFDERYDPARVEKGVLKCPPPDKDLVVTAEAKTNYHTLKGNQKDWGMTALLLAIHRESACYGPLQVGYIFLFPGSFREHPAPYVGEPRLNCKTPPPMTGPNIIPFHRQMCDLMNISPAHFIGFSLSGYPFSANNIGYNSSTCNPPWFGDRTIPFRCPDGTNWQKLIANALQAGLGKL